MQVMNNYTVKVSRDSVSLGDDIGAPHSLSFEIENDATLDDIFGCLFTINYIASVSVNDDSWSTNINGEVVAIFKGN